MPKVILAALILMHIVSCNKPEAGNNKYVIHPTVENLLSNDEISNVIFTRNEKNNSSVNKKGEEFLKKVTHSRKLFQLGVRDEINEQIFSGIDQVIISEEMLFLFDGRDKKVSVFDLSGNYVNKIGREGKGPGELNIPTGIALKDHHLFVADRMYAVKRAKLENDYSASVEDFFSELEGMPESLCISGNTLIIKATLKDKETGESSTFHQYDMESREKLQAFGKAYKIKTPIGQEMLSEGLIACDSGQERFLNVNYSLPYLYSFDKDGEIEWISEVDQYQPLKFREEENGMSFRWDKSTFIYDQFRTLLVSGDYILLQVERIESMVGENKKLNLVTYIIDADNGEGSYLGSNFPNILFVDDNYIVTESNEDYPEIEVFSF